MAPRSTSVALALALIGAGGLASIASAQAFGRFGYVDHWKLPGLVVDRAGFSANYPAADRIRFPIESATWKATATSDSDQTVTLDGADAGPSKIRAVLTAPGFSMYFDAGFALNVGSTSAPYLTWREGSAAENLPTPDERWIVLSFQDAQPPIVFGFPAGPVSLKIVGKPGNWKILGPKLFSGWVRVGLPTGIAPVQANTAASLGGLAVATAAEQDMWAQPAPQLQKVDIQSDEDGVEATWSFDRPGTLVPQAVTYAFLGGYPLQILSKTRRVAFSLGAGPIDVCSETTLKIRLPVRQIPTGRCLAVGGDPGQAIGTVSALDLPSVVELALDILPSTCDAITRHTADGTLSEYLSEAAYFAEPHSGQLLPYNAAGTGIDLAAAQAMLMQAAASSSKGTSEANSLLTSVAWRRDWLTWLPWTDDDSVSRRAAALAALAGAICPEPDRRLAAAMFQAGLSGERGLNIWLSRHGLATAETPLIESMHGLRAEIFRLIPPRIKPEKPDPEALFAAELVSPIRIFGDLSVRAESSKNTVTLNWLVLQAKPGVFQVVSPLSLDLDPVSNLPRFHTDRSLNTIEVRYTPLTEGLCLARLGLPKDAPPLPPAVPVPHFSEQKQ